MTPLESAPSGEQTPRQNHVIVGLRTLAGEDKYRGATWEICTNAAELILRLESRLALLEQERERLAQERDAMQRRAEAAEGDMGDLIDERDAAAKAADKLAYAIAPIGVIGEHSSGNDPWDNALDYVASYAENQRLESENDELRKDRERLTGIADYWRSMAEDIARDNKALELEQRRTAEDRGRLDWLEANQPLRQQAVFSALDRGISVREALDAARSAPQGDAAPHTQEERP
jgi:hypothetical protein